MSGTTSPERPAAGARGARLLVAIIGGGFLLLIAAFVGMIFFVHDEARLNAVGPIAAAPGAERGGVIFHGTANIWEVRGRLSQDGARQASVAIDFVGPTGQPAPADLAVRLGLERADDGSAAQALEHRLLRPGSLVATSAPLAPGRWRLRITLPEIEAVQEFRVEP
ncbi:hypothetical protein CKCBHOJB_00327 [Thauera sp. GDN1]|uniref:FixH family protein n=1 Tax=Thauera sp. GDN1 TaxID=2944810 RepID=UPI0024793E04|nr:FixH family protein [Thauera sp. GDN1]WEN40794.1 hypothetical protein CKCBHOJB_00327 [Thauera sp. GDN1]